MQEYYEAHYEDPVGEATKNDDEFHEMHRAAAALKEDILQELGETRGEMVHKINALVSAFMKESVMVCRNAYMMGVRDCDRARGRDYR